MRGGVGEVWRRTGANPETIVVTTAGGEQTITIPKAQQHFPARAFHQKELSTTMVDPKMAAENITGIAAAEVIDQRRRIDTEIEDAKRTLTTALQDLAAHWRSELALGQATSTVADIRRRLEAVNAQMVDGGVLPADLTLLADEPRHGRARNYLDTVVTQLAEDRARVEALSEMILDVPGDRYAGAFDFPEIAALREAIASTRERLRSELGTMLTSDMPGDPNRVAFPEGAFRNQRGNRPLGIAGFVARYGSSRRVVGIRFRSPRQGRADVEPGPTCSRHVPSDLSRRRPPSRNFCAE